MVLYIIIDHDDDSTGTYNPAQLRNNHRHFKDVMFDETQDIAIAQFV